MKQILFITFLLLLYSCNSDNIIVEEKKDNPDQISFTRDKTDLAQIKTATIKERPVAEQISCTGRIIAKPQNRAKISLPYAGYVKTINIQEGQFVKKNKVMLTLEHPDFIEAQKLYLQSKSELEMMKKEYERQKTLQNNGAGTGKVYEKAVAEYEQLKIEVQALKLKLNLVNINTDLIEKGTLISSIPVIAPIDGIINELNVSIGQFIQPEEVMMEIIGDKGFQFSLQVFEKDINRVDIGQKVIIDCNMPESLHTSHFGHVTSIGNFVDDMSKTFTVIAEPDEQYPGMRHGIFINSIIHLEEELKPVLPETAIAEDGDKTYVFIATTDTSFIRQYVKTGIGEFGYIIILEPDLKGKNVVVEGANYLKAEMISE